MPTCYDCLEEKPTTTTDAGELCQECRIDRYHRIPLIPPRRIVLSWLGILIVAGLFAVFLLWVTPD